MLRDLVGMAHYCDVAGGSDGFSVRKSSRLPEILRFSMRHQGQDEDGGMWRPGESDEEQGQASLEKQEETRLNLMYVYSPETQIYTTYFVSRHTNVPLWLLSYCVWQPQDYMLPLGGFGGITRLPYFLFSLQLHAWVKMVCGFFSRALLGAKGTESWRRKEQDGVRLTCNVTQVITQDLMKPCLPR